MPAAGADIATGARSQWAEMMTMARGLGIDWAQSKRSPSHCGSSRVNGAPWLTKRPGRGPWAGLHERCSLACGRTRARRSSYAAAGVFGRRGDVGPFGEARLLEVVIEISSFTCFGK